MSEANRSHVQLLDIFIELCESVDSLYSRRMATAARERNWSALYSSEILPSEYDNPLSFARDYAVSTFFSKYEGSVDPKLLHAKAITSFIETEERVRDVNRFLKSGSHHMGVEGIISDARRKIIQILGNGSRSGLCPIRWSEILSGCDWGKGATSSLTADVASLDNKICESRLSVTRRALKYALSYLRCDTSWTSARLGQPCESATLLPSEFNVCEDGRFATVPKNWKSRRSIDIQPTLNLFFQKGFGSAIRRRLKRHGIDLDDQSRNQLLASQAQRLGYATIDLAKASDTVATELVRILLPDTWFEVLNDLRTHSINIDGESYALHKFSAMGNGFTFELETLIFYALAYAVQNEHGSDPDSSIAVYGDDIIISQKYSKRLIDVLTYCGFEVNLAKSFTSGRFYESCGKHFFDGCDVTPFYQKEVLIDLPSYIRLSNRIQRWAFRMGSALCYDDVAFRPWALCVLYAHDALYELNAKRIRVARRLSRRVKLISMPFQPSWVEGDAGISDDDRSFTYDQHGSIRLSGFSAIPLRRAANEYALLANTLRKGVLVETPFNGLVTLRGGTSYQLATRRYSRVVRETRNWLSCDSLLDTFLHLTSSDLALRDLGFSRDSLTDFIRSDLKLGTVQ